MSRSLDPVVLAYRRERAATLTREGRSATEIADILGVSPRTVARYRRMTGTQLGEPSPRLTDNQIELIRQLLEDGCSRAETARTVGVSPHAVRRHFPDKHWTREQTYEHLSAIKRFDIENHSPRRRVVS